MTISSNGHHSRDVVERGIHIIDVQSTNLQKL